jgi:hypothetical protein
VRCCKLLFGRNDAGRGTSDIGCGRPQLAAGIDGGNGNINVQRLRGRFRIGKIRLRLGNRDLVIFRINLDKYCPLFHIFIVTNVYFDDITRDSRADRIEMNIHLGVVSGFIAGEIAPQ